MRPDPAVTAAIWPVAVRVLARLQRVSATNRLGRARRFRSIARVATPRRWPAVERLD